MSEPHTARLGLCSLAVLVLAILAIIGSDAVWDVVLTLIAIGLVAAMIMIDVWRLMDRTSGEPSDDDLR